MDKDFWKRELLLSSWQRQLSKDRLDPARLLKSTIGPFGILTDDVEMMADEPLKEEVLLQQSENREMHKHLFYPYSLALGAACGLLILTVLVVYIFLRRNRSKCNDEEKQASSSILVYPTQQSGSPPQFLTKEIHFSLPPLRSTSLGDLVLSAEDPPYDGEAGSESLLLPSVGHHNFRSNSFSCYGLGVIEPALYKSTLDLDEIQWPDGHIGRLWFSLRYEPSTEKLLVSLLKAKNLPSRTIGTVNSCEPFVRLHLMPDERRYLQSRQKKKTCNPYFDETLVFQVSAKDMADHTLKLTVIDGGRTKKKGEIGHVTFPLKDLDIGDGLEQELFKMDLEKEAPEHKTDLGELLISLVYNENISRLTATVIEARRLKDLRKHKQESETCEIELVANDLRHTLIELKEWTQPKRPEKRLVNMLDGVYIYNDPYGVVLVIGAWNYPILLALGPVVGAIAAGNTVILKPSELAPYTAHFLATVLTKYLDKACFQVYLGGIEETSDLLEEKFDYIFFTGSTHVGKIVHQAAAKNLTPCTLELGGKSPVFLDETADMEKATRRILWGKLLNSGQTCISPDYLLCTKSTQNLFLQEAKKIITEFYGSDPKSSTYLSKIVTERHFKRLVEFINPENVAIGGKYITADRIIAPTILIDVSPDDPVMLEEIFGPILPVMNVKNYQEAIQFINDREKPLALYVFTKNKEVRNAILTQTSSGGAVVNDTATHLITENLPFGGVGFSGMGSYHGKQGYDTFSHKKSVLMKDFGGFTELTLSLRYPPYNEAKTTIMNVVLKKRRGIPSNSIKTAGVFSMGFAFSYAFHFMWCLIGGCKY